MNITYILHSQYIIVFFTVHHINYNISVGQIFNNNPLISLFEYFLPHVQCSPIKLYRADVLNIVYCGYMKRNGLVIVSGAQCL